MRVSAAAPWSFAKAWCIAAAPWGAAPWWGSSFEISGSPCTHGTIRLTTSPCRISKLYNHKKCARKLTASYAEKHALSLGFIPGQRPGRVQRTGLYGRLNSAYLRSLIFWGQEPNVNLLLPASLVVRYLQQMISFQVTTRTFQVAVACTQVQGSWYFEPVKSCLSGLATLWSFASHPL